MSIVHLYVTVDEDDMKKEKFGGTLADFAAARLTEKLEGMECRVVSIESKMWTENVRPRQDRSDTWYDRRSMQLSVWTEVPV